MALLNYLLFIIAVVTLPLVENAPSNFASSTSKDGELGMRLVFIDSDANNAINNNVKSIEDTTSGPVFQPQSRLFARSKHFAKATWTDNNPSLVVKSSTTSKPAVMEDERQIWGIAVDNKEIVEDESYYIRPLALPKNVVKTINTNTNPDVIEVPKINNSVPKPNACDESIVICCGTPSTAKDCFKSKGCSNATDDMFSYLCSPDSINRTIALLGSYYKGDRTK